MTSSLPPMPPPGPPPQHPGYRPPSTVSPSDRHFVKGLVLTLIVLALVLPVCAVGGGLLVIHQIHNARAAGEAPTLLPRPKPSEQLPGEPLGPTRSVAPGDQPPTAGAAGTPVRDGAFEFVVQKFECGTTRVEADHLMVNTQGQFCVATVSVKNVSGQPVKFYPTFQKALTPAGTKVAAEPASTLLANLDNADLQNPIGPGSTVTGKVVYDIAKDATLDRVELCESLVSPGAQIAVG